jgi:Glycosyltransferase family 9 (heptosyltransferase)
MLVWYPPDWPCNGWVFNEHRGAQKPENIEIARVSLGAPPVTYWPHIWQHARRLRKKFGDARSTAGTGRALLYLSKFIVARRGLLVAYFAAPFWGRKLRDELVKFRSEIHGEVPPLIAIKITGGIGDLIVIARYIRDLLAESEPFRFDIYCNSITVKWVFHNVPELRSVYSEFLFERLKHEYPLALWISQFVLFYGETANWGLLREHKKLVEVLQNISRSRRGIEPLIAAHPYLDGYLAQKAVYSNCRRANFLHKMSKVQYGGDKLELLVAENVLEQYGLRAKQYLTIHNGFDPAFVITAKAATKCYHQFGEVVRLLKAEHREVKIVQLGSSSSIPISGVDINLIDKTTIEEAAGLIKHALLHIDNEGGLVHVARCLGVRSCVVFGPTPAEYFGYPENINFRPLECGGCWWINETWMDQCPRGFDIPKCMESHLPATIASAISSALHNNWHVEHEVLHFTQQSEHMKERPQDVLKQKLG